MSRAVRVLALLATGLMAAAVFVVVTSGRPRPAVAANSAVERLDENRNRPFGGANRYITATALADQYADGGGSLIQSVDTVVIVSGKRDAPDAAVAAGLAGVRTATVLLTEPNRLTPIVKSFLQRRHIREVIVVGGINAISEAVLDQITEIEQINADDITRISGEDRIATSVAVARAMGEPGEYCDTGQVSAILVNADSLVDASLVAPLVVRSNLPVLYTRGDRLAPEVATYLVEAEIEHVLVMGSTVELSADVVAAVHDTGVLGSTRIGGGVAGGALAGGVVGGALAGGVVGGALAGGVVGGALAGTPAQRSVELARALQQCSSIEVSRKAFALVDAQHPVDSAAAGPLLGVGFGASDLSGTPALVPILLVDDTLPSAVSVFLEQIPRQDATEAYIEAELIALGGDERVSPAVMEAALDAAVISPPLTVHITALAGTNTVTVFFSGDVTDEALVPAALDGVGLPRFDAKNRGNYSVAGVPLVSTDSLTMDGRTLTIELSDYMLKAGDAIVVADGVIKGVGDDNRTVRGTRVAIMSPVPDTTRPRLTLEIADNAPFVVVLVNEANPLGGSSEPLEATEVTVQGSDGEIVPLAEDGVLVSTDGLRYVVYLAGNRRLEVGDVARIAAGAVKDANGRGSRSLRARVVGNSVSPRVVAATITKPETLVGPGVDGVIGTADDQSREAEIRLTQTARGSWVGCASTGDCAPEFALRARFNGRESGVPGNRWKFQLSYDAELANGQPAGQLNGQPAGQLNGQPVATVTVLATIERSAISVGYGDAARVSDVLKALRADDTIVSRFEIIDTNEAANPLLRVEGAASVTETSFRGGASRVELRLTYNDVLAYFNRNEALTSCPELTAADLVGAVVDPAGSEPLDSSAGGILKSAQTDEAWLGNAAGPIIWQIDFDPPSRTAVVVLISNLLPLPSSANTLVLPAGLAANFDCAASAAVASQVVR